MTLPPFQLDPVTARRVFPPADVTRARVVELTAALEPHSVRDAPYRPDEAQLRLELTVLHLSCGNFGDAAGVNAVAALRANAHPTRRKADRTAQRHAHHLSRLGLALGWQWHGRYVHSTLLYLELLSCLDDLDRETQALTELCSATNDADQGLWDDAAVHFEQAVIVTSSAPVLTELRRLARTGFAAAERQAVGEVA